MPYKSILELPQSIREYLPKHAQEIYKEAFDNAWNEYAEPEKRRGDDSREEAAHKVAWSAVNHQYQKRANGEWQRR